MNFTGHQVCGSSVDTAEVAASAAADSASFAAWPAAAAGIPELDIDWSAKYFAAVARLFALYQSKPKKAAEDPEAAVRRFCAGEALRHADLLFRQAALSAARALAEHCASAGGNAADGSDSDSEEGDSPAATPAAAPLTVYRRDRMTFFVSQSGDFNRAFANERRVANDLLAQQFQAESTAAVLAVPLFIIARHCGRHVLVVAQTDFSSQSLISVEKAPDAVKSLLGPLQKFASSSATGLELHSLHGVYCATRLAGLLPKTSRADFSFFIRPAILRSAPAASSSTTAAVDEHVDALLPELSKQLLALSATAAVKSSSSTSSSSSSATWSADDRGSNAKLLQKTVHSAGVNLGLLGALRAQTPALGDLFGLRALMLLEMAARALKSELERRWTTQSTSGAEPVAELLNGWLLHEDAERQQPLKDAILKQFGSSALDEDEKDEDTDLFEEEGGEAVAALVARVQHLAGFKLDAIQSGRVARRQAIQASGVTDLLRHVKTVKWNHVLGTQTQEALVAFAPPDSDERKRKPDGAAEKLLGELLAAHKELVAAHPSVQFAKLSLSEANKKKARTEASSHASLRHSLGVGLLCLQLARVGSVDEQTNQHLQQAEQALRQALVLAEAEKTSADLADLLFTLGQVLYEHSSLEKDSVRSKSLLLAAREKEHRALAANSSYGEVAKLLSPKLGSDEYVPDGTRTRRKSLLPMDTETIEALVSFHQAMNDDDDDDEEEDEESDE